MTDQTAVATRNNWEGPSDDLDIFREMSFSFRNVDRTNPIVDQYVPRTYDELWARVAELKIAIDQAIENRSFEDIYTVGIEGLAIFKVFAHERGLVGLPVKADNVTYRSLSHCKSIEDEWERAEELSQEFVDVFEYRDFNHAIYIAMEAILLHHRGVYWLSGVDPNAPATPPILSSGMSTFHLDYKDFDPSTGTWAPSTGTCRVRIDGDFDYSERGVYLPGGSTLYVDYELQDSLILEYYSLLAIEPDSSSAPRTNIYRLDGRTVALNRDTNKFVLAGEALEPTLPARKGVNVIGSRICQFEVTLFSDIIDLVPNYIDTPTFDRGRKMVLTIGPEFSGYVKAVTAYSDLARNDIARRRAAGFIQEYC